MCGVGCGGIADGGNNGTEEATARAHKRETGKAAGIESLGSDTCNHVTHQQDAPEIAHP